MKLRHDAEKIVLELVELRVAKGYSNPSLLKYLREEYGLHTTRSYELINLARAMIGEMYANTNSKVLEDAITSMEKMKEDALQKGDRKLALEVQKEINKVNQLYIQKLDITSGGDKIIININGSKS